MKYQITQHDLERINQVKEIIERNFSVHYTHEQLAHFVGTNEERLKSTFKIIVGKTLYQYLVWYRVQKGKEFLEYTTLSTEKIAHKLGWDKSNFFKAFKKIANVTPVVWRRAMRKKKRSGRNKLENTNSKNSGIATFRVLHCVCNSSTCLFRYKTCIGNMNGLDLPILNYKVNIEAIDSSFTYI